MSKTSTTSKDGTVKTTEESKKITGQVEDKRQIDKLYLPRVTPEKLTNGNDPGAMPDGLKYRDSIPKRTGSIYEDEAVMSSAVGYDRYTKVNRKNDMSQKDFSYLEYRAKHNPNSREDLVKGAMKAYYKDMRSGKPWSVKELNDAMKDARLKPEKREVERLRYWRIKEEKGRLGKEVAKVISGDKSEGDMAIRYKSLDLPEEMRTDTRYMKKYFDKLIPEEKKVLEEEYNKLVKERSELVKGFPQKRHAFAKDVIFGALVGGYPYAIYAGSRDAMALAAGEMKRDYYHPVDRDTFNKIRTLESDFYTKKFNLFNDAKKREKEQRNTGDMGQRFLC